jgi:hypothetical protein
VPYEEETRARAEQILQDNLNAVRHNFEFLPGGYWRAIARNSSKSSFPSSESGHK